MAVHTWKWRVGWALMSGLTFALVGWALSYAAGPNPHSWPWIVVGAIFGVAVALLLLERIKHSRRSQRLAEHIVPGAIGRSAVRNPNKRDEYGIPLGLSGSAIQHQARLEVAKERERFRLSSGEDGQ